MSETKWTTIKPMVFPPLRAKYKDHLREHLLYKPNDPEAAGSARSKELAQLFAAAPDLYAACEAALAYIDERDTDDWPPALDAMLRDALAAARGESHAS